MHSLIDKQARRGKGVIQTMQSSAFWDRHLFKVGFMLHLMVCIYIITKHVGNMAFRIYDWTCWLSAFPLFVLRCVDIRFVRVLRRHMFNFNCCY